MTDAIELDVTEDSYIGKDRAGIEAECRSLIDTIEQECVTDDPQARQDFRNLVGWLVVRCAHVGALTQAVADAGAAIASAHISTYGERAVDAFYLQTREGGRVLSDEALARLKNSLLVVLAAGSGD